MNRSLRLLALVAAVLPAPLGAQEREKPFTEKVEVRVRSVLVFVTDAKGKSLSKSPAPQDLRVLEDGRPAEVVAVEPARRTAGEAARTAPPQPAPAAPPSAAPTPASRIPQYLYVDTTSLQVRSVPRIAKTVEKNLDAMLANGPLEIVVADPEPTVTLASTSSEAAIRGALEALPSSAVGKSRIFDARRDAVNQMIESQYNPSPHSSHVGASSYRIDVRSAIRQEIALIQDSLRRLDAWSATLPYDHAAIVYLCTDGFDSDLTEVYRNILMESPEAADKQQAMQIQQEFQRDAANFTARAADVLAGRGATAVVLAFGGTETDLATSAANLDKMSRSAIRRPLSSAPTSYYVRPFEPLLAVAERTGGQVVSAESKLPQALDEVGGAYLVSFRSHVPTDGAPHPLEIASAGPGLRVRAPRSVLAAAPRAASAVQAVHALAATGSTGSLPLTASISPVEKLEKGRIKGTLTVSADFASIAEALERTGPGRVRVTVAVENSRGAPFTQSEEADLDHSGGGTLWYYEANIVWPPEATRVAVTVEELATGASGSAVAELPAP